MSTVTIKQQGSIFELSGSLNRHSVPDIHKKHLQSIYEQHSCTLDFSQIQHVDTAGLAWVLLVVEKAQKRQCEINFINLPQDMVKLAKLSAVDTLFPSQETTAS